MGFGSKNYWLKQGFFLSFALNVLFLFLFYCSVFRLDVDRPGLCSDTICFKEKKECIGQVDSLMNLDFKTLISLLSSSQMIDGHPVRDWALGILFSKYCVDVVSGLDKSIIFHRLESSGHYFYLPQDLNDADFLRIRNFCASENYPYSTQGLFRLLSQCLMTQDLDEGLFFRFLNSKEFLFFKNLVFCDAKELVFSGSLMRMVIEGGEDLFFNICSYKNMREGISVSKKRRALLSYLEKNQVLAAQLLLDCDMAFILNEAPDSLVIKILNLVNHSDKNVVIFLERILRSCRGEKVKSIAQKMYNSL